MKKFIKEFRNELVVASLLVIGLAFLVASMGIRREIRASALGAIGWIKPAIYRAFNSLIAYILTLSIFDIIGWVVVILAVVYIYGRIRYRYSHNPRWDATVCPRCGGRIHRKHRSAIDRLLGKTLMPSSRRYRCVNPECRWTGLRRERYHIPSAHTDEVNPKHQEIS